MRKEIVMNVLVTVLTAGLLGAFGWIWHMETRMVLVEDHQITGENERKVASDLITDWPGYKKRIEDNEGEISDLFTKYDEGNIEKEVGLQRLMAVETEIRIYHQHERP